jgi:Ferredoxin-like domain in Api92-like protein
MHQLFPEQFAETDPLGQEAWDYEWFVQNTGSKWAPDIDYCEGDSDITVLDYDTARSPNNGTLQRLHDKTGWTIRNDYIEEGMQTCGRFTCESGACEDEEQEYMTSCEICEARKPDDEYDEELDGLICNACRAGKSIS